MVSTGLIAIDATILATAVPSIVRDLGGFSQFPWLFSVYLLAQAVSVPVYAKLADTVGRKPVHAVRHRAVPARARSCAGSRGACRRSSRSGPCRGSAPARCSRCRSPSPATSTRSPSGPGRRATSPASGASRRSSARRSAACSPSYTCWRWIFFVNVPLCLLAGVLISRNFHEKVERRQHRIDYAGRRAAHQRHDPAHPRRARGRPGLGVELADEHRRLRRRRRAAGRLRVRRAARRRAGPAAVGAQPAAAARRPASSLSASAPSSSGSPPTSPPTSRSGSASAPLVAGLALAALTLGWPLAAAFRAGCST